MSDQEKKEQEIMNQEMSKDEMETVAGGGPGNWDCTGTENSDCIQEHYKMTCDSGNSLKYGRYFYRQDGSPNCAATVEEGSWCGSDDACYGNEVQYLGLTDCAKAWK